MIGSGGLRSARRGAGVLSQEGQVFLLFFLPVLLYGTVRILQDGSASIRVHDNLDSNFVNWSIAAEGRFLANPGTPAERLMNGAVPLSRLANRFSVQAILFSVLPPARAYLVNEFLVRMLAFLGMWLLAARIGGLPAAARGAAALTWALAPFMTIHGLSVAGQPLLLWAFLESADGRPGFAAWTIIAAFPFWSSFVLAGVFIGFVLGIWIVVLLFQDRPRAYRVLLPAAILGTMSVCANLDLFARFLSSPEPSQRSEFRVAAVGVSESLRRIASLLLKGHTHAVPGWNVALFAAALSVGFARLQDRGRREGDSVMVIGFAFAAASVLFYGFYDWDGFRALKSAMPLLKEFQFERFYFLLPAASFAVLLLSSRRLGGLPGKAGRAAAPVLVLATIAQFAAYAADGNELNATLFPRRVPTKDLGSSPRLTHDQYFAPSVFEAVKAEIGLEPREYRVLSVGLAPAIAAGNGLYCLDAYLPDYPLAYKKAFRKVIAEELESNPVRREYFDGWGSRCYVFAGPLDDLYYGRDDTEFLERLVLSRGALREIWSGPVYLVSAVPILDVVDSGFEFLGEFGGEGSPWMIRLYRVMP